MTAGTRAIDLDPTGSPAYTWMGLLQSVAGRYVEALASAQRDIFVHKWAAIEKTHVFPVQPIVSLFFVRASVADRKSVG